MSRLRSIFGRLQWKLTFSYTLVTSAAVIVLLLLALLAAWTLLFRSDVFASALTSILTPLAGDAAPLLAEEPPSPAAVAAWLDSHYQNGLLVREDGGASMSISEVTLAGVVGAGGELLAATPGEWAAAASLPQAAQTTIAAALADAPLASRTVRDESGGALYLAAPVRDDDSSVLGALFIRAAVPQTREATLRSVVAGLLPVIVPVILGAGAVGALFGFVAARGLTRRLRALAATADAWSRGDFTAFVQDHSADEIGALGRRLNQMAEQLQNLLQTREELAAVEERSRLARELHDAVKQQLFATAMQIAAAQARLESDPAAAERHLAEAATLAQQAQRELAGLILELRPAALADQALDEALQAYVVDWSRQSGVAVQLDLAARQRLPLGIEQALFRVAQEALSNVARHSGAGRVTVSLQRPENNVRLQVRDDGRGFTPQAVNGGYGLETMRQRMAVLGGALQVHSAPGSGTVITAVVPLPEEKPG
jgi:NarL family two-component system sensor histidine kinase LiaS